MGSDGQNVQEGRKWGIEKMWWGGWELAACNGEWWPASDHEWWLVVGERVWGVQVRLGECGEGCKGLHSTRGSEGERGKSDLKYVTWPSFLSALDRSYSCISKCVRGCPRAPKGARLYCDRSWFTLRLIALTECIAQCKRFLRSIVHYVWIDRSNKMPFPID